MAWLVNMVALVRWLTASPNHPWRSSSSDPAIAMSKPGFTTWRPPPRTAVPVGQTGRATTILRPSGKARFGDLLIDVTSDGPFIEPGSLVEVIDVHGSRVTVKRLGG